MTLICLCLHDAIDWADIFAAGGVEVPYAFHTGGCIDDVDGIAFCDRFGWAFGQAGAAGNAIILNFHSHGNTLLNRIWIIVCLYGSCG